MTTPKTAVATPEKMKEIRSAIEANPPTKDYKGGYMQYDRDMAAKLGVTKEQIRYQRDSKMHLTSHSHGISQGAMSKVLKMAAWIANGHMDATKAQIREQCKASCGFGMSSEMIDRAREKARRSTSSTNSIPGITKSKLYITTDAAKLCKLSVSAFYMAVKTKKLVPDQRAGKIMFFFGKTLVAWRKTQESSGKSLPTGGTVTLKEMARIVALVRAGKL